MYELVFKLTHGVKIALRCGSHNAIINFVEHWKAYRKSVLIKDFPGDVLRGFRKHDRPTIENKKNISCDSVSYG